MRELKGGINGGEIMKMVDTFKHHKTHKYVFTGFVVGGLLVVVSMLNILVLEEPLLHPLAVYITLVPGLALILRSIRPPMGMLRCVTTLVGGALVGTVPMLLTSDNTRILWSGVICGLVGAALLGVSFTPKPQKEEHGTL